MTATPHPDCPFCRQNNLLRGEVLAETTEAFMVAAGPDAANYLIIPNYHVELLTELHDSWWQDVKMLLQAVPTQLASYNVTVNYGRDAGQSVSHLHFWVVPRLPGQPASGKGMTGLIGLVNAGGAAA